MNQRHGKSTGVLLGLIGALLLLLPGCGSGDDPAHDGGNNSDKHQESGHQNGDQHNAGSRPHDSVGHSHNAPHGGMISTVGNYHVEMVFDAKNKAFTLYVLGEDESKSHMIEAKPISIQVKVGDGDYFPLDLTPIPLEGEAKGKSSRFTGTGGVEMYTEGAVEAVVRIMLDGKNYRSIFQFTGAHKTKVYVCPMGCEKDKIYAESGKCPVCKMNLEEPTGAHADHNPKHGGDFFMAPNKWHHLEGVLASATEFRVYFYNNFTKPISADPFLKEASAEALSKGKDGKEISHPLQLKLGKNGDYLTAVLPAGLSYPFYVDVRVKFFDTQERPDPFSFSFHKLSEFKEAESHEHD